VTAVIRRATERDLPEVLRYLAGALGGTTGHFRRYFDYPWLTDKPEIGFMIDDGGVRGFIGVIYANRMIRGVVRRFCNLTSIAVEPSHRKLSLQLFKATFADKATTYTGFSPSKEMIEVLRFFKFEHHPMEKAVLVAAPTSLRALVPPKIRLRPEPRDLVDEERSIVRDHTGLSRFATLVVERGSERCFVASVRRGRTVRAYSEIVHVSNNELALETMPWIQGALALRQRTAIAMIETRLLPRVPRLAYVAKKFRPLMFRSPDLKHEDIDALYTELCL